MENTNESYLAEGGNILLRAAKNNYHINELSGTRGLKVELGADPMDYWVADDRSIEIHEGETLGHYADWLGVSSSELRSLNKMLRRESVVVGRRLKLAFHAVDVVRFEQRRHHFHSSLQQRFFDKYRISGVHNHILVKGDSLWELATEDYLVPMWLLRQYNPDISMSTVLDLNSELRIPLLTSNS